MAYKKMKERIKKMKLTDDKTMMLWEVDGKLCRRISPSLYVRPFHYPLEGEFLLPEEAFPDIAYKVCHEYQELSDDARFIMGLAESMGHSPEIVPKLHADERSGPDLSDLLRDLVLLRDKGLGEERELEIRSHYSKKK